MTSLQKWFVIGIACALVFVIGYKIIINDNRQMDIEQENHKRETVNDSLNREILKERAYREPIKEDIKNIDNAKSNNKKYYTEKTKQDINKPADKQAEILKELIEK